jgi:mono/diheme cytochrome c family protein
MSTFGQAYGGPLSDAQVSAIVAHLRRWDTDDLPTPSAVALAGDGAAGEIIYAAMCAECHGVDGRSDTAPDLANPAFLDAATDAFLQYALVFGRPGTDMEPAGLTEQEMADVIAYIRAFGEP